MRRVKLPLFILVAVSVFFIGSMERAAAQEGCLISSTDTAQVGYSPGWSSFALDIIVDDHDLVNGVLKRNSCVDLEVKMDGWGLPPFYWTLQGTGFHFGSTSGPTEITSYSDVGKVILCADSNACGSVSVYVTSSAGGQGDTSLITDSGVWRIKKTCNAEIPTSGGGWNCECGQWWDAGGCHWYGALVEYPSVCGYCRIPSICPDSFPPEWDLGDCCNSPISTDDYFLIERTGEIYWAVYVSPGVWEAGSVVNCRDINAYNCDNSPNDWSWPVTCNYGGESPTLTPAQMGALMTGCASSKKGPLGVRVIKAFRFECQ